MHKFSRNIEKGGAKMFQVNVRTVGTVRIFCKGKEKIKIISKEDIQKELEKVQFQNKECQRDIEKLNLVFPFIEVISLSCRKDKIIGLYKSLTSFGEKKPEIIITGNYPLYNMLKKLIE